MSWSWPFAGHCLPKSGLCQPLSGDEIRLLILRPGPPYSKISCQLLHTSLSRSSVYEALSYEWGPPKPRRAVFVGGEKVSVTDNLYWALHSLRLPHAERVVWVDALCINQKDVAEKNLQIPQMARIYSHAEQVVIYLGRSTALLADLLTHSALPISAEQFYRWLSELKSENAFRDGRMVFVLCEWFFKLTYWTRTWIIQEVVTARSLMLQFSDCSAPWEAIELIFKLVEKSANDSSYGRIGTDSQCYKLYEMRRRRANGSGFAFYELLNLTRTTSCTDPRDRIYSILGLVDDAPIVADYSVSTTDLYEDMIRLADDMPLEHVSHFCSVYRDLIGSPFRINPAPAELRGPRPPLPIVAVKCRPTTIIYTGHPWKKQSPELARHLNEIAHPEIKVTEECVVESVTRLVGEYASYARKLSVGRTTSRTFSIPTTTKLKWPYEAKTLLENFSLFIGEFGEIGLGPAAISVGDQACWLPESSLIIFRPNSRLRTDDEPDLPESDNESDVPESNFYRTSSQEYFVGVRCHLLSMVMGLRAAIGASVVRSLHPRYESRYVTALFDLSSIKAIAVDSRRLTSGKNTMEEDLQDLISIVQKLRRGRKPRKMQQRDMLSEYGSLDYLIQQFRKIQRDKESDHGDLDYIIQRLKAVDNPSLPAGGHHRYPDVFDPPE
jgi:hypothetical protein